MKLKSKFRSCDSQIYKRMVHAQKWFDLWQKKNLVLSIFNYSFNRWSIYIKTFRIQQLERQGLKRIICFFFKNWISFILQFCLLLRAFEFLYNFRGIFLTFFSLSKILLTDLKWFIFKFYQKFENVLDSSK